MTTKCLLMLVIVVGFCLDSLLKVRLGSFYLHLSLPLLVIWFLYLVASSHGTAIIRAVRRFGRDIPLFVLTCYTLAHFAFAQSHVVFLVLLIPLLIFIFSYSLVAEVFSEVDWILISRVAVIVLLATGAIQFFLWKVLGIQITLRGEPATEYNASNFGSRMRGLFIEPNYYGLMLLSWLYVLLSSVKRIGVRDGFLSALSVIAFVLSGNRIVIALGLLLLIIAGLQNYFSAVRRAVPVLIALAYGAAYIYFSIHFDWIADRSAGERLVTSSNVIALWRQSSWFHRIVGYGFSNWGLYSNQWRLSVENVNFSFPVFRRDAAESYVFLFEMGLIAILIVVYDICFVSARAVIISDAYFVTFIYLIAFFYPIYQFIYYVVPLMIIRSRIIQHPEPGLGNG